MKIWKEKDPATGKYRWHGDGTVMGRRLRPVAKTKEEVEAVFAAARARKFSRRYDLPEERPTIRLSELVAERVRDLDTAGNKNHKRTKVVLESFRDHFKDDPPVERLTPADVLSFKRARLEEFRRDKGREMKPNSINRELEAVTTMLRSAAHYFPSLEAWRPPAMPYERVPEEGRQRVVTRDEARALLEELRKERRPGEQVLAWRTRQIVADLWELAPHVGMRRSEMRLMEKSWVDFDEGLVHLPRHVVKTKRARPVPLNGVALSILRRRFEASPHPRYVFANARGTNALGEYQLYRAIRGAAQRSGVPYGRDVEGGFTLHDNRHTAVTRMLQSGSDLVTVGDVVGHSKKTMTLRYGHSTLESKRRAVEKLERFSDGPDKNPTEVSGRGGNRQGPQ